MSNSKDGCYELDGVVLGLEVFECLSGDGGRDGYGRHIRGMRLSEPNELRVKPSNIGA